MNHCDSAFFLLEHKTDTIDVQGGISMDGLKRI